MSPSHNIGLWRDFGSWRTIRTTEAPRRRCGAIVQNDTAKGPEGLGFSCFRTFFRTFILEQFFEHFLEHHFSNAFEFEQLNAFERPSLRPLLSVSNMRNSERGKYTQGSLTSAYDARFGQPSTRTHAKGARSPRPSESA